MMVWLPVEENADSAQVDDDATNPTVPEVPHVAALPSTEYATLPVAEDVTEASIDAALPVSAVRELVLNDTSD